MRQLPRNQPATAAWNPNYVVWVAGGLLVLAALLLRLQVPALYDPLDTDEADYASALRYGIAANYLGLKERSGWEFLASTAREFREKGRARPFRDDWAAGDAAALRHYHPPPALYPSALLLSFGERREHVLRFVPLTTALMAVVAAAWLAWMLTRDLPAQRRALASALALAFVALSPWHVASSVTLSFHQGFWLLSTLVLGFATCAWRTGSTRSWYALAALLGVAVATIPYWLLLVPVAAATLWRAPWSPGVSRRRLGVVGILFAAVSLTLVWPPALVRGDLVKPAILYAWIVVEPLERTGRAGAWLVSLVGAHWWVLAVLLLPVLIRWRGARVVLWNAVPVLGFAGLFVLLNSRVHHMKPLYASAVVPAAAALASVAIALVVPKWIERRAVPIMVAGALLVLAVAVSREAAPRGRDWQPAMATLAARLSGRTVLVAPRQVAGTFRYYLPASRIVPDAAEAFDEPAIAAGLADGRISDVIALPIAGQRMNTRLSHCYERQPDVRIATMNVLHWRRRPGVCPTG